ncbi:hypothetical protein Clacol_000171 [Clathrus columnatus]|uniref:Dipeptidase n=1 Tax=Clathrus columnatus TaxID=1419009 RepID=A0AAV4ZWB3_9AGAM|nr:hypothetical protein Clacol_000171 [Clathrus columnatus]
MSPSDTASERSPLLDGDNNKDNNSRTRSREVLNGVLTLLFIGFLVGFLTLWNGSLSKDPHKAAVAILSKAPVIDGHIDLPILVRHGFRNNVTAVDLRRPTPGHLDIPRLRTGKLGGFFWSVYVSCADDGEDFLVPTNRVRDSLEQIDVAKGLIEQHGDVFQLTTDTRTLRSVISRGKVASMLGAEGGHQLGNSLSSLRMFYDLGVRYMTLTHSCHNAFADSAGILTSPEPKHGGLSPLGRTLIQEMNRLGMLVDLSHTSDETAIQAIELSKAPVMWSHSSARSVWNVPRNVPDNILKMIGLKEGQKDGVIMVNFAPQFVAADGNATLYAVADHVDHIGNVAGRDHVGLGSDFDGIGTVPEGLEDVSKYPDLFAELRKRGWSRRNLAGLAGGNFVRVWEGVERVSKQLKDEGAVAAYDIYDKRTDL